MVDEARLPDYLDTRSLEVQEQQLGVEGFLMLRNVFEPAYFRRLQQDLLAPYQRFSVRVETPLYHDIRFHRFVSGLVGCAVGECRTMDQQTAWIRLYAPDVRFNPYSRFHIDLNRYRGRQFRVVISLFDDSACHFEYRNRYGGVTRLPTEENSLCVIEAGRLRHRVDLRSGRRVLLMMDFTTTRRRGVAGSLGFIWDYAWMKCVASRIRTRMDAEAVFSDGR